MSWKIEFEFKSNEGVVTGVYLHPFLDELLITKYSISEIFKEKPISIGKGARTTILSL